MGTPDYIAPEQAMESHTVDIRADLYSLGCTLYYLLTGRAPFAGGSLMEKLLKHRLDEPRPVEQVRTDVPPEVAGVVRKLMAKKPEDRYQTPAEAAAALAAAFSVASGPPLAARGAERTVAEGLLVLPVAATSGDTLASALGYMARRGDTREPSPSPRPRRTALDRRWLLYPGVGCVCLLAGAVVLWFLLKVPAGKKPQDPPVVVVAPSVTAPTAVKDPWLTGVVAMPAEKQVEAVVARLKEMNPGFDGKATPTIEGRVVTGLALATDNVTDISPVRALTGLRTLGCGGSEWWGKGKLADLSPLKDLKLANLDCHGTPVSDLSPLKGKPLIELVCCHTRVTDLSPLKGMKLTGLWCPCTSVSDLSPLKDMKLTQLNLEWTNVSDLSPLKDMKLTFLNCSNTGVSDLSPLKGMPLKNLVCPFKRERDAEILHSIKSLETINGKPAADFWKEVDGKKP